MLTLQNTVEDMQDWHADNDTHTAEPARPVHGTSGNEWAILRQTVIKLYQSDADGHTWLITTWLIIVVSDVSVMHTRYGVYAASCKRTYYVTGFLIPGVWLVVEKYPAENPV